MKKFRLMYVLCCAIAVSMLFLTTNVFAMEKEYSENSKFDNALEFLIGRGFDIEDVLSTSVDDDSILFKVEGRNGRITLYTYLEREDRIELIVEEAHAKNTIEYYDDGRVFIDNELINGVDANIVPYSAYISTYSLEVPPASSGKFTKSSVTIDNIDLAKNILDYAAPALAEFLRYTFTPRGITAAAWIDTASKIISYYIDFNIRTANLQWTHRIDAATNNTPVTNYYMHTINFTFGVTNISNSIYYETEVLI